MIDMCLKLMKLVYSDYWLRKQHQAMLQASGSTAASSIEMLLADNAALNEFAEMGSWTTPSASSASSIGKTNEGKTGLMRFSNEFENYEEMQPYFVRDPLNKDSFVIPPPALSAMGSSSQPSASEAALTFRPIDSIILSLFELCKSYIILESGSGDTAFCFDTTLTSFELNNLVCVCLVHNCLLFVQDTLSHRTNSDAATLASNYE